MCYWSRDNIGVRDIQVVPEISATVNTKICNVYTVVVEYESVNTKEKLQGTIGITSVE